MSDSYLADKIEGLTGIIRRFQTKLDEQNGGFDEVIKAIDFNSLLLLYEYGLIGENDLKNASCYQDFLKRNDIKRFLY